MVAADALAPVIQLRQHVRVTKQTMAGRTQRGDKVGTSVVSFNPSSASHMYVKNLVNTVPADAMAPNGVISAAGKVLIMNLDMFSWKLIWVSLIL